MNTTNKIKYSPMELKILEAIPENGTMINIYELIELVYKDQKPRWARQSILTSVNSLIEKSDDNEEPWELFKSKPRGSQSSYFWRKPRG